LGQSWGQPPRGRFGVRLWEEPRHEVDGTDGHANAEHDASKHPFRLPLAESEHQAANNDRDQRQPDAAHWHPAIPGVCGPATRSWKQTRFDVSNVQLTFHEDDTQDVTKPDGSIAHCVLVEPDIDYYKDLVAHGLLEVVPNLVSGGKTDPRTVYQMRWMAMKQEGLPEFAPPVTIK